MRTQDLENYLLERIRSGELRGGSALPTRHELMSRFGVARGTVDRVIRQLALAGVVRSVRGSGTFVLPSSGDLVARAYIILPGRADSGATSFWGPLLMEMGGRMSFGIHNASEVQALYGQISRPGSRVAWFCPSLEHFATIASLDRAGIPQLLLNRRHPDYSYVSTDTGVGIEGALERLTSLLPAIRPGILMPALNPAKPYWAERIVLFFATINRLGLGDCRIEEIEEDSHDSVVAASRRMLAADTCPNVVFIPEQSHVPTFRTVAIERGIGFGRDQFLVMTDYVPELSDAPGILALEQPYDEMRRQAAAWLTRPVPSRLQLLLPPIIHGSSTNGEHN